MKPLTKRQVLYASTDIRCLEQSTESPGRRMVIAEAMGRGRNVEVLCFRDRNCWLCYMKKNLEIGCKME